MAATTIDSRTRTAPPRWQRARGALAKVGRQAAATVAAVRRHNWSPALTVGGLGCIDTGLWEHFGQGTGWIAIGVSLLLFDFSREKP